MSFGYYMNMEKMTIEIAEKMLADMTNSNYEDDLFLSKDQLINNLECGFVIVTQMVCYLESYLNTILSACIDCEIDEILLKCSIEEKINIIYLCFRKDFSRVKGMSCWNVHKKNNSVRNELMHFKNNSIGMAGGVPNFMLKQRVGEYFTYDNMRKVINEYNVLTRAIAQDLGLMIYENVDVIECDGCEGPYNYVTDEYFESENTRLMD